MKHGLFLSRLVLGAATSFLASSCSSDASAQTREYDRFDEALFRDPPPEYGPHVRWWWPGGAVDDDIIAAEVAKLAEAGFGGIEQQTLSFDLTAADLAADARVRTVGTPTALGHVATFLREAKRHALQTAVTMGSGWPTGGTFTTDQRPLELLKVRVDVTGPATLSIPVPTPAAPGWTKPSLVSFPIVGGFNGPFDLVAVLAAPILSGTATPPVLGAPIDVTASVQDGKLAFSAPSGSHAVLFVFRHRVDQLLLGDAFPVEPAAARAVNLLDPAAVNMWLGAQQGAWLDAMAPLVPDELFVDSFEFVAELPWSDAFAARFAAEKGYDLTPYLPYLFRASGESKYEPPSPPAFVSTDEVGERVREDYEDLRGQIFSDAMVSPLARFAAARGTALRLQAHGGYEHVLDAYAVADVPESEGLYAGGTMDFLALAPSAAHVSGRRIASSETFPAFSFSGRTLGEEEMWMLAGRAYTAGIQRLVYHGVTYPYARANGERWYPFAATAGGAVNVDVTDDIRPGEPSWAFLPAFNRAISRLTYAMTRGVDRAEVAWLLDEREIPDTILFRAGAMPPEQGESATSLALRKLGFRYDRVSPRMIASSHSDRGVLAVGQAHYRALLVTDWPAANPDELSAVARALDAGVPVIVLGALPARARGYAHATARDAQVATTMAAITPRLRTASGPAGIASALAAAGVAPAADIRRTDCVTVSLAHRETDAGHLFFVFHEHPADCQATLALGVPGKRATIFDPTTGAGTVQPRADELTVSLKARRPLIVFVERP